jgi:hypothetical protein
MRRVRPLLDALEAIVRDDARTLPELS